MNQGTYLLLAALALIVGLQVWMRRGPRVSPPDAAAQVQRGEAVLVDVREPDEWNSGVAAPALLLPLSDLQGSRARWKAALEEHRGRRILVYCRSGMRSAMAARTLRAEGFEAANAGSFGGWRGAGLPVRQP